MPVSFHRPKPTTAFPSSKGRFPAMLLLGILAWSGSGLAGAGLNFAGSVSLPAGMSPSNVAAGDFNRDGTLDLVATNAIDGTLSIYLGRGGGHFRAGRNYHLGRFPVSLAVTDLSGDGIPDLAVVNAADKAGLARKVARLAPLVCVKG